jgi:hypothetical protein
MHSAENHIDEVDFGRYDQMRLTRRYFRLLEKYLG